MDVHEDRDWVCRNESCTKKDVVVKAGYFQVFPAKLEEKK
jgi:hypothetical protein